MIIEAISEHGIMTVYARKRGHETWVPKYIVIRKTDGRTLEEFRRRRDAERWAEQNREG